MHKRLREVHGLAVPHRLVHDVMTLEDVAGLEKRKVVGKVKKRRGGGPFTSLVSFTFTSLVSFCYISLPPTLDISQKLGTDDK